MPPYPHILYSVQANQNLPNKIRGLLSAIFPGFCNMTCMYDLLIDTLFLVILQKPGKTAERNPRIEGGSYLVFNYKRDPE